MSIRPAACATDRIRLMGDSYAYACAGMVSRACRHSVTLLCAVGESPLELQSRHGTLRAGVLLVAPLVSRRIEAAGTPFVLVDLEPSHASFRRIARAAGAAGVQVLPPELPPVQALRELCGAFHAGRLQGPALDASMRAAVTTLADIWPDPGPLDPRVAWMMGAMDCTPCITLERLAQQLALSPTRASRLFSAQMGIPSRAYAMAAKVRAAARRMGSGCSLTEVALAAGFADSAHFAKVWLRCYGAPPSRFFQPQRVQLDADGLPDWARWRPPALAAAASGRAGEHAG